jgi:uncharacterized protein YcnI
VHQPSVHKKILKATSALVGGATLVAATMVLAAPANAHASIQLYGEEAKAGGYGAIFIRIPHGCEGGLPTDKVVVSVPRAVESARPQQLSGWEASTPKSASKKFHRVVWSGGSLPDSQFADFGISLKYPTKPGEYKFVVTQHCGEETVRWTGADAPTLMVHQASDGGHSH